MAAPTPQTFGFVVSNTPGDETTLTGEVSVKGAKPDTRFEVLARQTSVPDECGVGEPPVGKLTTNDKGNGSLYFTVKRAPPATSSGSSSSAYPISLKKCSAAPPWNSTRSRELDVLIAETRGLGCGPPAVPFVSAHIAV